MRRHNAWPAALISDHLDNVRCASHSGAQCGFIISARSPSQHPDCPDSGYKLGYNPGRMPPLAFPVGMARQFVFPPNSVTVVFPFKWLRLINNYIYPPKSSLPLTEHPYNNNPGPFSKGNRWLTKFFSAVPSSQPSVWSPPASRSLGMGYHLDMLDAIWAKSTTDL